MRLSQPVSQLGLIVGKALSRFLLLCGVTFVCALLGLLVSGASLSSSVLFFILALHLCVLFSWGCLLVRAGVGKFSRWCIGKECAYTCRVLVGLCGGASGISEVVVDTLYPPPSHVELLHEAREAAQAVEEKLNALEDVDIDPKKGAASWRLSEVQEALLERSSRYWLKCGSKT